MKGNLLKCTAAVVLMSSFVSCALTRSTQWYAEHPLHGVQKLVAPETGREVVFVPMQHMSSDRDYETTRRYLDTLKARGYVTFCEGVVALPFHIDTISDLTLTQVREQYDRKLDDTDSLHLDTLLRKCRRMLGFMPGKGGYADPENASIKGNAEKRKRYISQSDSLLNLTTGRDIWVDYTLSDITEVCEQRYGKIELTDYDFQTGLYERYVPEKHAGQRMRSYYMIFARNDLIVNRIADSNHPKIAVVYGAGHSFGVVYFLKKAHGFRADKRYKAEQEL